MAINQSKRYTTTGTQAGIDVNASHSVTFGFTSENSDITITNVEVKIGNNWYVDATTTPVEGKAYTFAGAVDEIRCSVSSMGTSTYFDFDYTTSNR